MEVWGEPGDSAAAMAAMEVWVVVRAGPEVHRGRVAGG